jgi:hypothetical protein
MSNMKTAVNYLPVLYPNEAMVDQSREHGQFLIVEPDRVLYLLLPDGGPEFLCAELLDRRSMTIGKLRGVLRFEEVYHSF